MPDLVSSCPGRGETLSPPIFPNRIASSDAGLPQRAFRDNERRVGGMPEQLSLSYFHFSSASTRASDWLLSRSGGGAYENVKFHSSAFVFTPPTCFLPLSSLTGFEEWPPLWFPLWLTAPHRSFSLLFFFFPHPFSLFCPQSHKTPEVQTGVSAEVLVVSYPSQRWKREFLQTVWMLFLGDGLVTGAFMWQSSDNFVESSTACQETGDSSLRKFLNVAKLDGFFFFFCLPPSPCTTRPFSASSASTKATKWCRCFVKPLLALSSELCQIHIDWPPPPSNTHSQQKEGLCKCMGWLPCGKAFLRSALKLISS